MAGNVQSNVHINVTSNIGNLVNTVQNAMSEIQNILNDPQNAVKDLGFKAVTLLLEESIKLVDEFTNDMMSLGNVIGNTFTGSIDFMTDAMVELNDQLIDCYDRLSELADVGTEIQEGYFTLFNYLGDEAGEDVVAYTNKLEKLFGLNADDLVNSMDGILGMATNMGLAGEELTTVANGMLMFTQDLAKFSGASMHDIVSKLEGTISLGAISVTSPLVRALNMTAEDVKAFRELSTVQERATFIMEKGEAVRDTYLKWLETSAGKVEQYRNSVDILNNSISKLALDIFAKIAPALQKINELLTTCINSLSKLLGFNIESADSNSAETIDNVSESIENLSDTSKEANKQLAVFDDVIQLSKGSDSGLAPASGDFDISLFDSWIAKEEEAKTKWDDFVEKFKNDIESGDFYKAGARLAGFFNDLLADVPWDDIKSNLHNFGFIVAEFFNSILADVELFGNIGTTLTEGINSVFSLLLGFGRNFNFAQFGVSAGVLWDSFWDDLDASDIGETFYQYIIGGFEALAGFLEEGSLSDMTSKIGDTIVSFFNNFTEEDIKLMAGSIIDLIDDVFGSIGDLHNKLKDSGIKDKLKLFITELFTGFSENSGEWGTTLGDAIEGLLELAYELLVTADQAGLSEGISKFLDGLDLEQIMFDWFMVKFELWWIEFKATWKEKLKLLATGIFTGVLEILGKLVLSILAILGESLVNIWKFIEAIGIAFYGVGIIVFDWFGDLWQKVKDFFSVEKWKEAFSGLAEAFKVIWDGLKTYWNSSIGGKILFTVPEWVPVAGGKSFKIPKLATGGIIGSPTLAMVGENGAEAIVPLENNLGWIDKLATRVASKINNNKGGSSNVTISLSELNKPFYSRSEMLDFAELVVSSLRQYGVNVALVN